MQRVTKQSIVSQEQSASLNNINVNASLKQQRAVKAQEALYEGAIPINVAVAILIRCPSPNALDEACRYFCSCFQRPAWVERETEYAWLMWKQTLPITFGNRSSESRCAGRLIQRVECFFASDGRKLELL